MLLFGTPHFTCLLRKDCSFLDSFLPTILRGRMQARGLDHVWYSRYLHNASLKSNDIRHRPARANVLMPV